MELLWLIWAVQLDTGDIGKFTHDGYIQIIDQKKNKNLVIVILKGGKYVNVDAMETTYVASPYLLALCVIASNDLNKSLPIVIVNKDALRQ